MRPAAMHVCVRTVSLYQVVPPPPSTQNLYSQAASLQATAESQTQLSLYLSRCLSLSSSFLIHA